VYLRVASSSSRGDDGVEIRRAVAVDVVSMSVETKYESGRESERESGGELAGILSLVVTSGAS
jgi:hypothetical protein